MNLVNPRTLIQKSSISLTHGHNQKVMAKCTIMTF